MTTQNNVGMNRRSGFDAPIDYEYEVGMVNANISVPHLALPEAKETLFVTKPIDDYEPFK